MFKVGDKVRYKGAAEKNDSRYYYNPNCIGLEAVICKRDRTDNIGTTYVLNGEGFIGDYTAYDYNLELIETVKPKWRM